MTRLAAVTLCLAVCWSATGCGSSTPPTPATPKPVSAAAASTQRSAAAAEANRDSKNRKAKTPQERPSKSFDPPPAVPDEKPSAPRAKQSSFADIARLAESRQFALPELDDGKIAAAGIRKLEGKHLILYTDAPADPELNELPQVFDAAVPLWARYFSLEEEQLASWQLVGCVMVEKERFIGAGLYPENLPEFPNGYSRGSQFWLFDQPSGYYRRHLLLHEGTHAFMNRWLGGAGPPWYMEGMAELLATHRWTGGNLELARMPASKEEVPYWGRVKIVRDEFAASRGMTLDLIMQYDARAHLNKEPYGWCWAAAAFFDQHPLTQAAFRELKTHTRDRSGEFSSRFQEKLRADWPAIVEDWQLFVIECDYGYDVPRAAVMRKPVAELPEAGGTVKVAADRGWQSSGFRVEAGRTYAISASGRIEVAAGPPAWPAEAGGVTLRYSNGQPLGKLLAAVSDLETEVSLPYSPLSRPTPIGLSGTITPEHRGTLYFKINEPAAGLADNTGAFDVTVKAE